MAKLFDRVKVNITITGTGTVTFGPASSPAFNTPLEAGAADGDKPSYVLVDGTNYEEGVGTILGGGTQMARTTIRCSKIDGVYGADKINLSGTAVLAFVPGKADLLTPDGNLAELSDKAASRGSLGLGNAATRSVGTSTGTVAAGDDARIVGAVQSDEVQSLNAIEKAQARANIGVLGRNRIINGQFAINQREAAGGIADNAYSADRWRIIGEFSTANIFADNFNAAGSYVPAGTLQFAGTTDKGGFFQVIEGRNCKDLRGKIVTLSMLIQINNARLGNMKIGILEWTGTEDATTGDPVSSWGADGVTPTLATNWAFKSVPANLAATTSPALYSATATLGTTFTNLAVIIWNDDKSYTASDNFSVTNVQLEEGGVATPFDQRPYGQELYYSQRYFSLLPGWIGKWFTSTSCQIAGSFWTKMRATPAVSVAFGTAAMNDYGVSNPNLVSFSAAAIGDSGGYINFNTSAATSGGLCAYLNSVGKVFLNAEI